MLEGCLVSVCVFERQSFGCNRLVQSSRYLTGSDSGDRTRAQEQFGGVRPIEGPVWTPAVTIHTLQLV